MRGFEYGEAIDENEERAKFIIDELLKDPQVRTTMDFFKNQLSAVPQDQVTALAYFLVFGKEIKGASLNLAIKMLAPAVRQAVSMVLNPKLHRIPDLGSQDLLQEYRRLFPETKGQDYHKALLWDLWCDTLDSLNTRS